MLFNFKGAPLRWGAFFLITGGAITQTVFPPRIYTYYKLPSDTGWIWQSVVIDPPLTLTQDSAGQVHLGLSSPPAAGPLTSAGSGAIDCVDVPGQCDIVTALVPLKTSPNAWQGSNDFTQAARLKLRRGHGVPDPSECAVADHVANVWIRDDAGAKNQSVYVCVQIDPSPLYGWELH